MMTPDDMQTALENEGDYSAAEMFATLRATITRLTAERNAAADAGHMLRDVNHQLTTEIESLKQATCKDRLPVEFEALCESVERLTAERDAAVKDAARYQDTGLSAVALSDRYRAALVTAEDFGCVLWEGK